VITGTHGKTTTASILTWILYEAGLDPSFMIGGILRNFGSNYRLGNGEYVVIEGDEYDTAYFDKGSKFLHYDPSMAILTSVEFDHADIFRDMDHVKQAFNTFIGNISPQSTLIAFDGDKNISDLIKGRPCRVETYGRNTTALWRLGKVTLKPPWTFFEVLNHHELFGSFKIFQGHLKHLKVLSGVKRSGAKKTALRSWTILPIIPRRFGRPSGR